MTAVSLASSEIYHSVDTDVQRKRALNFDGNIGIDTNTSVTCKTTSSDMMVN